MKKGLPPLILRNASDPAREIYTLEFINEERRSIVAEIRAAWLCPEDIPEARMVASELQQRANAYPKLIETLELALNCIRRIPQPDTAEELTINEIRKVLAMARE